jgi:undecaprenyl-diphosphatase
MIPWVPDRASRVRNDGVFVAPDFKQLTAFARREVGLIAALLAITLGVWAFLHIAEEVGEGDTRAFDTAVILAMRAGDSHDPIGPAWFEFAVRDLTALGGFAVLTLVTLIAVGFLTITKKYGDALVLFVAIVGGDILSETLKIGYARPRPDLVAHVVDVSSASFPSGHAMVSAATYLTIGALLARVQRKRRVKSYIHVTAIVLTLLIGVSRVYLGVHWPTDVLAGWCLGAAWSILCVTLASFLARSCETTLSP